MKKEIQVFLILACVFIANVILAEFIGVKIFSLEATLGFNQLNYTIFGMPMNLTYTAGVLIWPVVFVLTDIINDYYGVKGVKWITYLALCVTLYAFIVVRFAINLSPVQWWSEIHQAIGLKDFDQAYRLIFGQGNNIIIGSLIAFVIGQFLDAYIFQKIKRNLGMNTVWLRATASTLVSQLIDSFVVIYIAFYLGQHWTLDQFVSVALNNYIYKGIVAILMIPVLLLIHRGIEWYLGQNKAEEMRINAIKNETIF